MTTHAQIAAKLLRDAATFFRHVGKQNASIKDQMEENAELYEQAAELLEKDPTGAVEE